MFLKEKMSRRKERPDRMYSSVSPSWFLSMDSNSTGSSLLMSPHSPYWTALCFSSWRHQLMQTWEGCHHRGHGPGQGQNSEGFTPSFIDHVLVICTVRHLTPSPASFPWPPYTALYGVRITVAAAAAWKSVSYLASLHRKHVFFIVNMPPFAVIGSPTHLFIYLFLYPYLGELPMCSGRCIHY